MKIGRRQNELIVPLFQVITDIFAITFAFLFSYWLRFNSPLVHLIPVTKGFPGLKMYFWSSIVVIVIWLFIFKNFELYGARRNSNIIDEFYGILKAVTLGMLFVTAATFFYRGFSYSRLVFIMIWTSSIGFLFITRFFIIRYERYLHKKGKGLLNAAIVGSGKWGDVIFEKIKPNSALGFNIIGYIGENRSLAANSVFLGEFDQIDKIAVKNKVDIFFIVLNENENYQLFSLIRKCSGLNVEFYLVPDLLEMMTSRLRIKEVEGIPVLKIKDAAMTGWNSIIKK